MKIKITTINGKERYFCEPKTSLLNIFTKKSERVELKDYIKNLKAENKIQECRELMENFEHEYSSSLNEQRKLKYISSMGVQAQFSDDFIGEDELNQGKIFYQVKGVNNFLIYTAKNDDKCRIYSPNIAKTYSQIGAIDGTDIGVINFVLEARSTQNQAINFANLQNHQYTNAVYSSDEEEASSYRGRREERYKVQER